MPISASSYIPPVHISDPTTWSGIRCPYRYFYATTFSWSEGRGDARSARHPWGRVNIQCLAPLMLAVSAMHRLLQGVKGKGCGRGIWLEGQRFRQIMGLTLCLQRPVLAGMGVPGYAFDDHRPSKIPHIRTGLLL
jgi:hypothetical protein